MIREAIMKLSRKEDLTYQEAEEVMNEIMEGGPRMYRCLRI